MTSWHATKPFQTCPHSFHTVQKETIPKRDNSFRFWAHSTHITSVHNNNLHAFACTCFGCIAQKFERQRQRKKKKRFSGYVSHNYGCCVRTFQFDSCWTIHSFSFASAFGFSFRLHNRNAFWQRNTYMHTTPRSSAKDFKFWLEWFDQCCCECLLVQTMRK